MEAEKRRQKLARKMDMIALFDARIKALCEAGREVVVIGDLVSALFQLTSFSRSSRRFLFALPG